MVIDYLVEMRTHCAQRILSAESVTKRMPFRRTLTIRAIVMGDSVLCYGALEIVGLLLLLYSQTTSALLTRRHSYRVRPTPYCC